jgi:hypothetical protein
MRMTIISALNSGQRSTLAGTLSFPITHFLFLVSVATSSFDIFLTLTIDETSIRFAQLFQMAFVVSAITSAGIQNGGFRWPPGFEWLLAWGMFLVIWTPNTYHMGFSVGYTLWFLFSCTQIFSIVQIYGNRSDVNKLIHGYIATFVIIAIFGIVQWMAGIVGFDILVVQWWQPNLPRINGFSYEPSYFATYLITGWGMLIYFYEVKSSILSRKLTIVSLCTISTAIILSTSRMGILIIVLYMLFICLRGIVNMTRRGWVTVRALNFGMVGAIFSVFAVLFFPLDYVKRFKFLLEGLGVAGTANHSQAMRMSQFYDTLRLFGESPVIGYGLGGINSYLAKEQGLKPHIATGMNVTAELLAASGLLGFPFFIIFIVFLMKRLFDKRLPSSPLRDCLRATGVGFILLILILQFNQNILRLYVWNHFAIMLALIWISMREHGAMPKRPEVYRARGDMRLAIRDTTVRR